MNERFDRHFFSYSLRLILPYCTLSGVVKKLSRYLAIFLRFKVFCKIYGYKNLSFPYQSRFSDNHQSCNKTLCL